MAMDFPLEDGIALPAEQETEAIISMAAEMKKLEELVELT